MRRNIKLKQPLQKFYVYKHGNRDSYIRKDKDIVTARSYFQAIQAWFNNHPWLRIEIKELITRDEDPPNIQMAIIKMYKYSYTDTPYADEHHFQWYFAEEYNP
jgi:hypothetical protein